MLVYEIKMRYDIFRNEFCAVVMAPALAVLYLVLLVQNRSKAIREVGQQQKGNGEEKKLSRNIYKIIIEGSPIYLSNLMV